METLGLEVKWHQSLMQIYSVDQFEIKQIIRRGVPFNQSKNPEKAVPQRMEGKIFSSANRSKSGDRDSWDSNQVIQVAIKAVAARILTQEQFQ